MLRSINRIIFNPNMRILAFPVLVIVVSISLVIGLAKFGYPRITSLFSELRDAKKSEEMLEERLSILREFRGGAEQSSDITFIVLPDKNPGSWLLSQLKALTPGYALKIGSTEVKKKGENEGIKSGQMDIQLESDNFTTVANFLLELDDLAPINTIDEVEIESQQGVIGVKLVLNLFWSELPTQLPAISEPLKELSASDQETLRKVLSLKLPIFGRLEPEAPQTQRVNPFE